MALGVIHDQETIVVDGRIPSIGPPTDVTKVGINGWGRIG